jgi:DNA-binding transcriptional ArsR family regulator
MRWAAAASQHGKDTPGRHLDRTLMALADPTRRGVIELLRQEPRKASELADALSMTRPAMSRHLRLLRKTGLVTERELESDARVRMYRLERAPFLELRGWLDEVEGFWADQLAAFKVHVERAPQPGRRTAPVTRSKRRRT